MLTMDWSAKIFTWEIQWDESEEGGEVLTRWRLGHNWPLLSIGPWSWRRAMTWPCRDKSWSLARHWRVSGQSRLPSGSRIFEFKINLIQGLFNPKLFNPYFTEGELAPAEPCVVLYGWILVCVCGVLWPDDDQSWSIHVVLLNKIH